MRVKVEFSLANPIRRGAFLAGSEGTKHWVTLKYERLPLFCHHCGILGHDLRHCAVYFKATKNEGEIRCQYGDWLKATGGRNRSPGRRNTTRDEASETVHREENRTAQTSPGATAADGRVTEPRSREQVALRTETLTGNQGTVADSSDVAAGFKELDVTSMERSAAEVTNTVGIGFMTEAECDVVDPMQVVSVDVGNGPQSPNPKGTWTRLRRNITEPQEVNKESKPVLGKRSTKREGSNQGEDEHVEGVKRGKRSMKSNSEEVAGVSMHPCRSQ